MSDIPGSVSITGLLAPTSSADTYSVTDSIYGRDGLRNLSSVTDMYNITVDRRREGMIVGVYSGGTRVYFKLKERPWVYNSTDWSYINIDAQTPTIEQVLIKGNTGYTKDFYLSGRSTNYLPSSPIVASSYYSLYADNSKGLTFSSSTFNGISHFKMFNHFFKDEFSFYSTENRMNSMFGIKHDYLTGHIAQIFSSATVQGVIHLTSGLTQNREYYLPDKNGTLLTQKIDVINISADDIADLGTTPILLISNPGTDKSIKIHNILFNYLYSGNTFSSAGAVFEVLFLPTIGSSILSFPANNIKLGLAQNTSFSISTDSYELKNNGIVFIKTTTAPISKSSSATTGTLKVIVSYEIVDLS